MELDSGLVTLSAPRGLGFVGKINLGNRAGLNHFIRQFCSP
jgi:hypothetical protein